MRSLSGRDKSPVPRPGLGDAGAVWAGLVHYNDASGWARDATSRGRRVPEGAVWTGTRPTGTGKSHRCPLCIEWSSVTESGNGQVHETWRKGRCGGR